VTGPAAVPGNARRIDVHHHAIVPKIQRLMRERGAPFTIPWSLEETWALMETNETELALVSNAIPGEFFDTAAQAARFNRAANEAVAELVADHPGRFGLLAALPMPHVDAALAEAEYAFDTLRADGVLLVPHAGDGYLGDPLYAPLFEELARRRATVLVHPMSLPGPARPPVPPVLADFLLDTTRGAVNLIMTGALDTYPEITFVLAHGGGFLPYAASRVELLGNAFYGLERGRVTDALRRFYFDVALVGPSGLPSLLGSVPHDRILFGTDWCAAPFDVVSGVVRSLAAACAPLPAGTAAAIDRDNAFRAFPGLARRLAVGTGSRDVHQRMQ
jgi:predicted TIM-barrel fold metal-dependent hydrolase